jgi:hypothetical protein
MWQRLHGVNRPLAVGPVNIGTAFDSLLEKSKLVQHAYEEGDELGWNEVSTSEI